MTARAAHAGMSAFVQVFGRRNAETIDALGRPAFKKRQGTKSREGICERVGLAAAQSEFPAFIFGSQAPSDDAAP